MHQVGAASETGQVEVVLVGIKRVEHAEPTISGPSVPGCGIGCSLTIRAAAGLTPRSQVAAEAGLAHTVVGVVVRLDDGRAIAVARAVGDGLNYEVVDVAVLPEHKGQGLGKPVIAAVMKLLREVAPAEEYVCLIADGEAHRLYAQYGFEAVAPASIGMAQ